MKSGIVRVLTGLKCGRKGDASPLLRQTLVAAGPLVSTVSLGMTSGYSAVLLPQLENGTSLSVDRDAASWIASTAVLPMAFGCVLGGFMMEKLGRKTTQVLTTFPCAMGWILIILSANLPTMLTGRFLTGLCGGLLGPSTGVYISETSEPKYRGFLLGTISFAVAFGLLLIHMLGTFLHWRTVAVVASFFPLVTLVLLAPVPESPSWLAKKQRAEEAQSAFLWCRGETAETKKEASEMTKRQHSRNQNGPALLRKEFFKPLIIIVVFVVTNQWVGVNALTYYTVSIMRKTLSQGLDEYLAMLIVDLIRVIFSILACLVMKKIGRRPLALLSGFGTCTSLFLLSGNAYFSKHNPEAIAWWYCIIPMTSLIAYTSFTSIGFIPLPWAMMGEVFPLDYRSIGSGISSFVAFIAFFSVVKTSPLLFDDLGPDYAFLIYGVVAFLGTVFLLFLLPETKDKTLEQIEDDIVQK